MPLLHEIKDLDNETILCFLPSGHLTDEGFKDFPAQIGHTCWYYAARRLAALKHTQQPFNEAEYGNIAIILSSLKNTLDNVEKIYELCLRVFYDLIENRITINSTVLQIYLKNLPSMVKDALQEEINSIEKMSHFPIKNKPNHVIFTDMFLCMGETFIANGHRINITSFQEFNITFSTVFSGYMKKIRLEIHGDHCECMPLEDLLEKEGIHFDLANKKDIEPFNLQNVVFQLNNAIIPITEDQELNYRSWKAFFIKVLSEVGPFIVAGDVGVAYYAGSRPKNCGTLGSLALLGFNNAQYCCRNINNTTIHLVIVIGVCKNKIIYLDPVDDSKVFGPRQAYIMDIYKFMERIEACNKSMYGEWLRLTTVKSGEIDTTLELMMAHTSKTITTAANACTKNSSKPLCNSILVYEQYGCKLDSETNINRDDIKISGCNPPPGSKVIDGRTVVPRYTP